MLSIFNYYELGIYFYFSFLFKVHVMFYDFTEVYHVNVNNALELANQSVHYIGFK